MHKNTEFDVVPKDAAEQTHYPEAVEDRAKLDDFKEYTSEFKRNVLIQHRTRSDQAEKEWQKKSEEIKKMIDKFKHEKENQDCNMDQIYMRLNGVAADNVIYNNHDINDEAIYNNHAINDEESNTSGDLDLLPDHVVAHIMSFLFFEVMIMACTNLRIRNIYIEYLQKENNRRIGYYFFEKIKKSPEKLNSFYAYGNYVALQTVIECVLFYKTEKKIYFEGLVLNSIDNYLITFGFVYPLYFENFGDRESAFTSRNQDHYYATYIVTGQHKKYIYQFFEKFFDDPRLFNILACIVGELISRGEFYPERNNAVTKFYKHKMQNHPYTTLPIIPMLLEKGITASPFVYNGYCKIDFKIELSPKLRSVVNSAFPTPSPDTLWRYSGTNKRHFYVQDITTIKDLKEAWNSTELFLEHELRILKVLNSTININEVFSVLLDAKLTCLFDINNFSKKLISAFEAFGYIFQFAANGPCLTRIKSGCLGRIGAWRTLAVLVGVDISKGIDKVEEAAKQCSFIWLHNNKNRERPGRWEPATILAVLRPDKQTISFLAIL